MFKLHRYFGVFDGHAGSFASEALRNGFHTTLVSHPQFESDIIKSLRESFVNFDQVKNTENTPKRVPVLPVCVY